MNLEDVIKRPLFTEKSQLATDSQQYTFEVALGANKVQVREAIEELFKVTVSDVNTLIVRGKPKRMGRRMGKTRNWKKAIVTLSEGEIDFYEGA